jgi:hypothetical protein
MQLFKSLARNNNIRLQLTQGLPKRVFTSRAPIQGTETGFADAAELMKVNYTVEYE